MKRRKQRIVLDVTFREPLTVQEAQNEIAQLVMKILLNAQPFTLQRIVAKEFSRVLRAEQRTRDGIAQHSVT